MNDPLIRRAAPDDAAAVAALAIELGYACDADTMRVRIAELQRDLAVRELLVIAVDGEVRGWIELAITEAIVSDSWTEIRGLVVTESARNSGLGKRLLAAAEAWARERGSARVRLRSNVKREAAHQFYLRNGFEITKSQHTFEKRL